MGKAKQWEKALQLLKQMREQRIQANVISYTVAIWAQESMPSSA